MKGERLGELEELILLTICNLSNKAYGVTIRDTLEAIADRSVSLGAIYPCLDRLQRKDFVDSWVGEPTHERGGRRRRFYKVTGVGYAALNTAYAARERLRRGIDGLGLLEG